MTASTGQSGLRAVCSFALATTVAALFCGAPALAQDAPGDRVVITVDGEPITESDLAFAARDLAQDLAKIPPEQRAQVVTDTVVEIKLFEKAAEKEGLDQKEAVKKRLAFLRGQALRNEYLIDKVVTAVTEEAIKKRFDEETAKFVPGDELHLHHILVKTEAEAKAIIAEIDKGGDFAAIAKEKSIDTGSGARGGDLDFIGRGATVKPFEDAAFALEVGKHSSTPVESQFGWHIIKLDEKRKQPPPTFEARQNPIRQELLAEFLQNQIKTLREAAKIVVVDQQPATEAPADKPAEAPPADAAPPEKPAE